MYTALGMAEFIIKTKGFIMKKRVIIFIMILIFSFSFFAFCDEPVTEEKAEEIPLTISVKQSTVSEDIYILRFSDKLGHRFNLKEYINLKSDEVRSPHFTVLNSEDFEANTYAMGDYNTVLYVYPQAYGDVNFKIRAYLSDSEFADFELKLTFLSSASRWQERAKKIILPGILLLIFLFLFWVFRMRGIKLGCENGELPSGFAIRMNRRKYFFSFLRMKVKEREEGTEGKEYTCNYFEIKKGALNSPYLVTEEKGRRVKKNVYISKQKN